MSSNNSTVLTDEQRARIAENRKQALERLKARNMKAPQITTNQNNVNNSSKILPSKVSAQSHRVNPYLKPPTVNNLKAQASNQRPQISNLKPQTVNKPLNASNNNNQLPKKDLKCSFETMSDERFIVKMSGYDYKVTEEFKKIPSKIYHATTRLWSFNFKHCNQLAKALDSLGHVTTVKIPEFVVKCLLQTTEVPNEACLNEIEPKLVDSLLDFQREGICYGIGKSGRCLIADDMGLGKTRQAIGIADFYRDDWPLLIVTNASTRQFWANEIDKLLPYLTFNDIFIIQNQKEYFGDAKVVICSYSHLQGDIQDLINVKFGAIIFDESHNIKNPKAKQTQNAELLSLDSRRIIMLTGTPALSRPVELFPQLKILDKNFATFHQFTARYCNGFQAKFGWNTNGCSYLDELNILLRKKFLIRRIKSDVFMELGEKNRKLVLLEKYKHSDLVDEEMEGFRNEFEDANRNNKTKSEEVLLKWYNSTSKIKAFGACAFVKNYLEENDCKILVFAHHTYMMNALCAELEKIQVPFIKIDGSVSGDHRAERVEKFQNDPHIRAAILSIRACNAGITLTAASTVIFCEFDWNPSTIVQAEARAHRIGQENEVKIYFLLAPGTVDDVIWKILQDKQTKLGKAGLVANVESLSTDVKSTKFNVKEMRFEDQSVASSSKDKSNVEDYFKDDDMDDAELFELVANLP